jgi:hypothetical protein
MLTSEDLENEDVVALYIKGEIYLGPAAVQDAQYPTLFTLSKIKEFIKNT